MPAGTTFLDPRSARAVATLAQRPRLSLCAQPLTSRPTARPFLHLAAAALGQSSPDAAHTLNTVRTLPYAAADLFRIIADVDSYASFLPHCTASRVTHWRRAGASSAPGPPALLTSPQPDAWPARADLTVGWGPLSQTYSSRVYCLPSRGIVEAVSGQHGVPTLTAAERAEMGLAEEEYQTPPRLAPLTSSAAEDPFQSLITRWTVVPLERAQVPASASPLASAPTYWCRVELRIRFQFRNPMYQLAAAQVGDEMAAKMIEAFEKQAILLLGPQSHRL